LVLRASARAFFAILQRGRAAPPSALLPDRSVDTRSGFAIAGVPYRRFVIFNENFDPSWQGFIKHGGRWQPIANFTADGFANAWDVPPNTPLVLVNTLVLLARISAVLGVLLLIAFLFALRLGLRDAPLPA